MKLKDGGIQKENLSDDEAEAVNIFNDYILCKTFGWTPNQIDELTEEQYQDFVQLTVILNGQRTVSD